MALRVLVLFLLLLVPIKAQAEMLNYPTVVLRTLDKSTARTNTVEANLGQTIEFGSLFIKVQSCRKSEPLDKPESASFLQIWEVPVNSDKSKWVFSGWMFASSPALSAMDHPVYDVWVLDCKGREDDTPAINSVKIDGEDVLISDEDSEAIVENASDELVDTETDVGNENVQPALESVLEKLKIEPEEYNSDQNYE